MTRLIKLVITLVVLVAILVGVDIGACAVAENLFAGQIKKGLALKKDPTVDVHGFPFLTQAFGGKYDHITVTAHNVEVVGKLRLASMTAELYAVKASIGDIVNGKGNKLRAASVDGTAKISQHTVAALLQVPSVKIEPVGTAKPIAPSAQAKLSGKVDVAGQNAAVTVYATLKASGGEIGVHPTKALVGGKPVPAPLKGTVLSAFSSSLTPGTLPYGVRPTGVAVRHGAILLRGHATNVKAAG